jgi:hypothetical protein
MGIFDEADQKPRSPNCLKCAHFKVSWDPNFPYSCTIFGIKTRLMPALEVFRSAGNACLSFCARNINEDKR